MRAGRERTTDHIPYVGRLHPAARHVWVAAGFGAWGMSNGVMAGRLLAALVTGDMPAWADLYDPRRTHPVVEAGSFVKANIAWLAASSPTGYVLPRTPTRRPTWHRALAR